MSLNLLPPWEIRKVKFLFFRRYIIIVAVLIITAEIIFSAGLFGMNIFLLSQYEKEKKNTEIQNQSVETEEIKKNEKKINDFNNYLQRLDTIRNNHVNWTVVVDAILNSRSEETKLDTITIDDESKKISIKGIAQTRESFLKFKSELEKIKYFHDFNSPLSNVINPANINFSLDFLVKTEEIR